MKALTKQNVPPVVRITPENEAEKSPMVPKSSSLHYNKRSDINQGKDGSFNYKF